jgi:hypothetical protein
MSQIGLRAAIGVKRHQTHPPQIRERTSRAIDRGEPEVLTPRVVIDSEL